MSHLGAYRVLKQLGEGGMASAWLAVAPNGAQVVLKIPLATDAQMVVRLHDEAQAGKRVRHPHVVSTLDFFVDAGRPVLVIEFIDGCALRDPRTRDNFRNPLPAAAVAWLGRTISEALCAIHEAQDDAGQPLGMLHRDVTASNILLEKDGAPKLIDLGIARSAENEGEKTQAGMLKGTLRYLAPELLMGEGYSAATDLWSLGVCLFEAALGRQMVAGTPIGIFRALTSDSYRTLRPGERLDPALQDALFALLADKNSRLRNARASARMFRGLEARLGPGQHIVAALVPFAQASSDDDPSAFSQSDRGSAANLGRSVKHPQEPAQAFTSSKAPVAQNRSAPPKVIIGDTEYGTVATLQMEAVTVHPPQGAASIAPGPTLVLPAVDIRLPEDTSNHDAAVSPTVRTTSTPAEMNWQEPTLVLPAVDSRPSNLSSSPVPVLHANRTLLPLMAARVAADGDVLPEGASTLQMPAWTPPEPAGAIDRISPNSGDPVQHGGANEPAPRTLTPTSGQGAVTRVLPVAVAIPIRRDDEA